MMASQVDEDPFLQVQADVLSQLNQAQPLLASYLRIRSSASSATTPELVEARTELETALQDLSTDLRDLVESVKAAEHDPYRYGLELDEVERRRRLVEDVGREVEGMREELLKTVHDAQAGGGKGKGTASGTGAAMNGDALPDPDSFDDEGHDDYAAFEEERQMELMQEQDEALDGVFRTVGNLRQQADDMGRELEDQAGMLEDVDNLADRVGGKLQTGLKKINWVIKKNEDTMSSCCIALLIFVLILLLILVLVL
ncbi:t-SNARE [Lineolata rhizophorae]|uniref:t-SNARE affecting a late Golgi compartment protein 1 n=1 Tax=Lineolata rhizophorae TaxID=578093 RepID=A0A6A6NVG5_9PEZI|nr:t-SNARE [Lineolata rhizophorae]